MHICTSLLACREIDGMAREMKGYPRYGGKKKTLRQKFGGPARGVCVCVCRPLIMRTSDTRADIYSPRLTRESVERALGVSDSLGIVG